MKTSSRLFFWVAFVAVLAVAIFAFVPKHLVNNPPYDANIGMPTNVTNFSKAGGLVTVINKTPVSNFNSAFEPGNTCFVSYDGDFTKVDEQGIRTIVSYQESKASNPHGTQCGSVTFFAVSTAEFANLRNKQIAFNKEMAQAYLFVEEHQGREGSRLDRNPWPHSDFTWVQVANTPNGATNLKDAHIDFGDQCGISKRNLKLSALWWCC